MSNTASNKKSDIVFRYPKRVERLAKEAASDALTAAKALGLSVTYIQNGFLVREGADGSIKRLKETRYPGRRIGAKGTTIRVGH